MSRLGWVLSNLAVNAKEPIREDLWATAVGTLGDDLKAQIDFSQGSKQESLNELLKATAEAKSRLDARSWSFTRNGKKVIVRDVLTKVVKWVNHFKEVGDIIVQYDPGHAALPWAGVRFLLNVSIFCFAFIEGILLTAEQVAVGDLDTYNSLLERTADIAELICRSALTEGFLKTSSSAVVEELERALVQLYAKILIYLAKARSYYRRNTASESIPTLFLLLN